MGRIPEDKIEEVRQAASIVDVISTYVTLKRRGRNFMGLCPFHSEKTPSFSVSPDKQIFHCFGCGKGGNVFSFLMEYEKVSFPEAISLLADRYGITLPRYEREEDQKTERLLFANQVAADFYQSILKRPQYKNKIGPYLYEKRGLKPEIVEKFKIGLAPDSWDELINHAAKKDITPQELADAGLAIKSDKGKGYYDRFRLRLMIPIYNLGGKVVAFGGRALRKGERAKYMNSPETPVYNKSNILYGLNFAREAIRDAATVFIVEGYFDYLALYQAGIENVVAVSGTAFTSQQARLLARFAQKAFLFFDADSAGRSAALRSVEHFFNHGIEPLILTAPAGHDPDTLIREKGPEAISELSEKALPYLAFRFEKADYKALSLREKEQAVREIKSLAMKIEDPLRRDIFLSSASEILKIPETTLRDDKIRVKGEDEIIERKRSLQVIESEFLSLFMAEPALIATVEKEIAPEDFSRAEHKALYKRMIDHYRKERKIDPDRLLAEIDNDTEKSALTLISTLDWGELDLPVVVLEYKTVLLNQKRQARLDRLQNELKAAEKEGDNDRAEKLIREIKYLLDKRA